MADPFFNQSYASTSAAEEHFPITPQDNVDLPRRPRALYIKTSGNIVLRDKAGATATYPVTAGQVLDFRAVGVEATGTTATAIGWI